MQFKLRWLTATALIALLCIIGLQVFWLHASYKDHEKRFMADAENAIISAQVKLTIKSFLHQPNSPDGRFVAAILPDLLSNLYKKANQLPNMNTKEANYNVQMPDSIAANNPIMAGLLSQMKNDTGWSGTSNNLTVHKVNAKKPEDISLSEFKAAYVNELKNTGIDANVELATLSEGDQKLIQSTCDTVAFKNIQIKTSPANYEYSDNENTAYVQAAFPSISWYFLREMLWILIISIILIVICISSFFTLIALFFKQKRISEIRDDFMNNMTHELKTPISSVSVALELIGERVQQQEKPQVVREYIEIAQGELSRLTLLVEKVLKIAAFEKSDIKIIKETFQVGPWIKNIINSFKPIFETSGVVCTLEMNENSIEIIADKIHLTNVLQNLIDNAVKYNDKSIKSIKINIYKSEKSVIIKVADNGKGIADIYINKIFDKFFRIPSGNLHNVKGYGLGLSYTKAVMDLHKGNITVKSTINEGSTFILTIPKSE